MPLTFPEHFLSRVIIVIIILVIAFSLISVAFGFDFFKQITQPPPGAEDLSEPKDLSTTQGYENYELNYEGMILERGVGVGNITQLLQKRVEVADCYECSSCNDVDVNGDGKNDIFNCQKCGMCGSIPTLIGDTDGNCIVDVFDLRACGAYEGLNWQPCDWNKNDTVDAQDIAITSANMGATCSDLRFKNCWGCTNTTPGFSNENCTLCDDMIDEYEICKKLKSCIVEHYADKSYKELHGCLIAQTPFNETASFDVDAFKNILKSCRSEPIEINVGNNILKELCYFNNTSISYYDFERPTEFYLVDKVFQNNPGGTAAIACIHDVENGKELTPFREENGQLIENYRIYVTIEATDSQGGEDYTIDAGHWDYAGNVCGAQQFNPFRIGTIKTDANGFGYAIFDNYGEAVDRDGKTWRDAAKEDPKKNKMTGVEAAHTWSGTFGTLYATFYSNSPASNLEWTNGLRYSNCNFNTNIEPYLNNKPWWASNDKLESSWKLTSGNQNSSIKVFYDSSMPGGEVKTEEPFSFTDVGTQVKEIVIECAGDCRDKISSPESICQAYLNQGGVVWHALGVDCEDLNFKNVGHTGGDVIIRQLDTSWTGNPDGGWCEDTVNEDMAVICINKPIPPIKEVLINCGGDCRDKITSPEYACQTNIGGEWHAIGVNCEDIDIKNGVHGPFTTNIRTLDSFWAGNYGNGWCPEVHGFGGAEGGIDMGVICMNKPTPPVKEVAIECDIDCRDKISSPEDICQKNISSQWHAIGVDCETYSITNGVHGVYTANVRTLDSLWAGNSGNGWCENTGNEDMAVICSTNPPASTSKSIRSNLKIQLGRLDTDFLRECKFDIYACSQDAFAEYEDDEILSLSDFFNNFNPNNVYKIEDNGNEKTILYNYFEFYLNKNYTIEEISSAIKTGFRSWEANKFLYHSSSSPIEWLKYNNGIYEGEWYEARDVASYTNDCWNQNIENYVKGANERAIFGNCPNNNCTGNLRIRIAFKYEKPTKLHPYLYSLYPIITFCSPESTATAVCGNNRREGAEQCDGTDMPITNCAIYDSKYLSGTLSCVPAGQAGECTYDTSTCVTLCSSYNSEATCSGAGCKWCSACSLGQTNSWGIDKCIDPAANCGYACIIGSCGANCKQDSDCSPKIPAWCHPNYCTC